MRNRLQTKPTTTTRYNLTDSERYALCVFCAFEVSRLDAFKIAHPEAISSRNVLKSRCDEFFASSDVVNFVREYNSYLDTSITLGQDNKEKVKAKISQEDREERKRQALEMLADDLIDQIFALRDGGEEVDRETIIKMVDKIGWFGNEEIRQEQPRRYLPETCSQCRYKIWIEENCEEIQNN